MASLLDRIYDNQRLYLIKRQAEEMHELIQNKNFNENEKANFCKKHELTAQDLEDLQQDNLDAFIDRHSGTKHFPWIKARLSNFLRADALLDKYRAHGWTVFVEIFHKDDDTVIRTMVRDPNNKQIGKLTRDFYSMVCAENWLAWKLQSEFPLTTTISNDLKAQYPVSDINHFDASNYNNALEILKYYQRELDDLYYNIRIQQEGQNFVYTTSISNDEQSTSFFYDHKNDIPKYTKRFPSHYNAIVWLALTIEKDFPINKTIAKKLKEELPIWNPDELPSYVTDAIIKDILDEKSIKDLKISNNYVGKYIQSVLNFDPE